MDSKLAFLRKTLQDNFQHLDATSYLECINKEASYTKADSMDVELVFRAFLEEITSQVGVTEIMKESSSVRKLISFAFDLMKLGGSVTYGRIPFLLFADLLEGQTISCAEKLWNLLESFTDSITVPESFRSGKFIVLKMCNALLKRLSKSCNPEFCGRVLMFLATVYAISERSAVNFTGKINTSNITFYEDEKTFQDIHRAIKLTSENISQEEKKNEKEHEKTHTQNDVENKVPVPGIVDYESDSEKVAEMVVENEIGEMKIDENSVDSVEMHEKYGLYKMFWGLQEFMCTENVKRFVDCAAVVGEAGQTTTAAERQKKEWNVLVSHAQAVLSAFEEAKYSEAERQSMDLTEKKKSEIIDDIDVYFGCKYLTSSELLSLQIRDPSFRLQLASQLLFYVNFLRSHPITIVKPPAALPAPVIITIGNKESRSGLRKSDPPPAPAETPDLKVESYLDITSDLNSLEERAFTVIEKTPPNGPKFSMVIKKLLERETNWKNWIKSSCPPFEKFPLKKKDEMTLSDDVSIKGKKRSLSMPLDGPGKKLKKAKVHKVDYHTQQNDEIMESARMLLQGMPTYEEHLQSYIDAEDPDNGIEAEYHPKKDSVYCWRARRLIASSCLIANDFMTDGDIGKGLAGYKKYLEASGETVAETGSTATVEGAESKEGEKDGVVNTEEKNEENEVEKSSEVRKGSEDKEKDEEDLNLTSDVEVNTMISDNAELVEMSTEIAVKEEAGESKDADVIKTENSSVMQE